MKWLEDDAIEVFDLVEGQVYPYNFAYAEEDVVGEMRDGRVLQIQDLEASEVPEDPSREFGMRASQLVFEVEDVNRREEASREEVRPGAVGNLVAVIVREATAVWRAAESQSPEKPPTQQYHPPHPATIIRYHIREYILLTTNMNKPTQFIYNTEVRRVLRSILISQLL